MCRAVHRLKIVQLPQNGGLLFPPIYAYRFMLDSASLRYRVPSSRVAISLTDRSILPFTAVFAGAKLSVVCHPAFFFCMFPQSPQNHKKCNSLKKDGLRFPSTPPFALSTVAHRFLRNEMTSRRPHIRLVTDRNIECSLDR